MRSKDLRNHPCVANSALRAITAARTAFDLLRYMRVAGGLDAVATVLNDPGPQIESTKLAALAEHFERATIQRLGYLLDRLCHPNRAEEMHKSLYAKGRVPWVDLEPRKRGIKKREATEPVERNEQWHVTVQCHPKIDE